MAAPGRFSRKDAATPVSGEPQPVLIPHARGHFSDRTQHEPTVPRARRKLEHSPFILFPDVVFCREVHKVNHWFGCQKQVFVQHFDLGQRYTTQKFKMESPMARMSQN